MSSIDENLNTPDIDNRPRRLTLAVLLSLVFPGLGHVYAGNFQKGLIIALALYVVILVARFVVDLSSFYGYVGFLVFCFFYYVYSIVSAARLAKKNRTYQLRKYNRWYIYVAIFLVGIAIGEFRGGMSGKLLGMQAFRVPTISMLPALQSGDFITVNTLYKQPIVGDVVVFVNPANPKIRFVKRIAALGGDTVSIDKGIVIRNGLPEPLLNIEEAYRQRGPSVTMAEQVIPDNEMFVLGDQRNYSSDSRHWGTVPVANLVGKVRYVFYSRTKSRIGTKVK